MVVTSLTVVAEQKRQPPEGAPVIVIYNNSGAMATSMTGTGSNETAYQMIQDYIYKETGIWVETITAPLVASESEQKLNLLLGSGERIDIWWGNWPDYYDTGLITKWNDFIKYDYMQNAVETWAEFDAWDGVTDAKGNIWGLPRMVPMSAYSLFFRQDWLDKLGFEIPTTMDELNTYLYAVKEADPYGNGATIPLGAYTLPELQSHFLGGFVATGDGNWVDEDGKVKPEYLADGYKSFIAQLATWYQDGILSKEAFSWDRNTVRDYIAKGQFAVNATWYSNTTLRSVQSTDNVIAKDGFFDIEKYTYVYMPNFNGIKGDNGSFIETMYNTSPNCLMINSKTENIEACLKYIVWQYDSWYNYMVTTVGLEGIHWRYDLEKDPNAVENHIYTGWSDENGNALYPDLNGNLSNINALEYCRDFTTSLGLPFETLATEYDSYGRQNQHNLWLQKYLSRFDTALKPGIEYGIVWDTIALEEASYFTDINTYFNENALKFITGSRSLDEWDHFIQELYDLGMQDMINEYTRQYNEFIGQ
jgi:ABC-type glycerol-3-phosphate transport system substrate-binding protein